MAPHSLHSYDCVVIRETEMITAGVFTILVLQNYRQESKPKKWYSLRIFPSSHPLLWFPAADWVKVWFCFCFLPCRTCDIKSQEKAKNKKKVHQDVSPTILGPICSPCVPSSLERQCPAKTKEHRLRVSSDCIILVLTPTFYLRPTACSLNVLQGRANGQKTAKGAFSPFPFPRTPSWWLSL